MFQRIVRAWHYLLLWLIVLVSLGLNAYLFITLNNIRSQARTQVQAANERLTEVDVGEYELPIEVDESLPVSFTVPFSDTFIVPISATIPVSASVPFSETIDVPINTNIPINTTVSVPLPAIGNIPIPIPIVTNIPVNLDVQVPISRSIPVQLDIPVDLTVEVPVESEVPVDTDIPVELDFPVTIPLDEMGYDQLLQQVQAALDSLMHLLE
ncbi:MAG: hypothetical protein ACOC9Z_03515 [Chloroflexota bacterium]